MTRPPPLIRKHHTLFDAEKLPRNSREVAKSETWVLAPARRPGSIRAQYRADHSQHAGSAACSPGIFQSSVRIHARAEIESAPVHLPNHGRSERKTSSDRVAQVLRLPAAWRIPSQHARLPSP